MFSGCKSLKSIKLHFLQKKLPKLSVFTKLLKVYSFSYFFNLLMVIFLSLLYLVSYDLVKFSIIIDQFVSLFIFELVVILVPKTSIIFTKQIQPFLNSFLVCFHTYNISPMIFSVVISHTKCFFLFSSYWVCKQLI